ncbi:MAG: pentapeptide repeat-containing protein, partial [Crocosphaera sp.]
GATLNGATLNGATLNGATLWGAKLKGANLKRAYLEGANLEGANLGGTYLYQIENLTNKQIKSACNWDKAIYSEGEFNEREFKWIPKKEQAHQEYIQKIRDDKASEPQVLPEC